MLDLFLQLLNRFGDLLDRLLLLFGGLLALIFFQVVFRRLLVGVRILELLAARLLGLLLLLRLLPRLLSALLRLPTRLRLTATLRATLLLRLLLLPLLGVRPFAFAP